jgi:hypothetical protein
VGGPYLKITQVRASSDVIQFLEMCETGEFAGADHPHVENWASNPPVQASKHLAIGITAGGGRRTTPGRRTGSSTGTPRRWRSPTCSSRSSGTSSTRPWPLTGRGPLTCGGAGGRRRPTDTAAVRGRPAGRGP